MNRRTRNAMLFSAILSMPAFAMFHLTPEEEEAQRKGGGGEGDKGKKRKADPGEGEKDDAGDKSEEPKLTLTQAELDARIKAAREEERRKAEEAKKKEKETAEAEEARKRGEFEKLADQEKTKREAAEQERDRLNRENRMLKIERQLAAHLESTHKDYTANAADIMLHVEKKVSAETSDDDVKKIIAEESKAFVERTPRKLANGAPAANPRSRIKPGTFAGAGARRTESNNGDGIDDEDEGTIPASSVL
jgi:hypothetical protein